MTTSLGVALAGAQMPCQTDMYSPGRGPPRPPSGSPARLFLAFLVGDGVGADLSRAPEGDHAADLGDEQIDLAYEERLQGGRAAAVHHKVELGADPVPESVPTMCDAPPMPPWPPARCPDWP